MYAGITAPQLSYRAGNNLEGLKFRVVRLTGTGLYVDLAGANQFPSGILTTDPQSGEAAAADYAGQIKVQVGGAVSPGQLLTTAASGYAVAVASGAAGEERWVFAQAQFAAASGDICRAVWYGPSQLNSGVAAV